MAYLISAFCLAVISVRAAGQKNMLGIRISRMLAVSSLTTLISAALLFSENDFLHSLFQGMFYACFTAMLYFLLYFIFGYIGITRRNRVNFIILTAAVVMDMVSVLLNPLLGHAFKCTKYFSEAGVYYKVTAYLPMQIHLFFCYILVVYIFALLVVKTVHSPKIYKAKYWIIILLFMVIVAVDAIHLMSNSRTDWSVLGFVFFGMSAYYYALSFIPENLLSSVMVNMIYEMDEAVIAFDIDKRRVFINDMTFKMLGKEPGDPALEYENLEEWAGRYGYSSKVDFTFEMDYPVAGDIHNFRVSHRRLLDEKDKVLGSFINIRDLTRDMRLLEQEHYKATHDALTSVYNSERFFARVKEELEANPDVEYIMACSDIRNFKLINDIFGYENGDMLLRKIASGIRQRVKAGDVYGRLQGDHFAILMKKKDFSEQVFLDAESTVLSLDSDAVYSISGYVGVYEIRDRSLPVYVMCDRALLAINGIKGQYKHGVAWFDENAQKNFVQNQELINQIDRAVEEKQLLMFIQPQVDTEGRVLGGEALVRWQHPKRGFMPPAMFIDVLEKSGQLHKLDHFIWDQACRRLRQWKDDGKEGYYISVNISPRDFFFIDIYEEFCGLIEKYDLEPQELKLEITETILFMDLGKQLEVIKNLQERGFIIEMDDFGSGYSSLSMLNNVKVDVLKIDMGFLRGTNDKKRSMIILEDIIKMTYKLGISVITEGVETKEQADFLTEAGCGVFQGYYFAKPMNADEFDKLYIYGKGEEGK